MKNLVIAIPSSHYVMITIIIVQALLATIFFEIDNRALGEGINFVFDEINNTMTYSQQAIETRCKSSCPSSAEMCIAMCA